MEEEIKDVKNFEAGVNHGYLLSNHRPDLLEGILQADNKWDDFVQGLAQGRVEYKLEKEQERMNDLQKIREKSKGRSLDREK